MRKMIWTVSAALLALSGFGYAQGFIPAAESDKAKKDAMASARNIINAKESQERLTLLKDLVEKDVLRDAGGRVRGDGYAVDAFKFMATEGVKKEDPDLRLLVVVGLGELDSSGAKDALIDMLNDPSDGVQLRAIQTIERKALVKAGRDVATKLRSPNTDVSAAAAKCVATLNYGGQGPSTGPMIELMVQMYDKLMKSAPEDPARGEYLRYIEILGRACGQLIGNPAWTSPQSVETIGKELDKFTGWWNTRWLPGLKDAQYDKRKEALEQIAVTADRGAFPAILDAVSHELATLQSQADVAEKQQAQQLIIDASNILVRISGVGINVRPTSSTAEIQTGIKQWQDWWTEAQKNP